MARAPKQPIRPESIEKVTLSAREHYLKRKHGSVHPAAVADYIPLRLIRMPQLRNEDAYGSLTDQSTYSEYAWAFLRRNRFYQKFIDEGSHKFRFADWGYLSSADSKPSFGLARAKPYYESFSSPTPPKWNGIHTFQDRLRLARPRRQGMLDIEQPQTQVAIIFDIEALLGDNTTAALEHQISMATKHLNALAEAAGIQRPAGGKPPNKKLLRAQLFFADLLSKRAPSSGAAEPTNGDLASRLSQYDEDDTDALQISDIATKLLPEYLLRSRTDPDGNQALASFGLGQIAEKKANKQLRIDRVSALVRGAWSNIYNWQLLTLLQRDDWSYLVPPRGPKRIRAPAD